MHRHETPIELATAVSRHAPRHPKSILDPAVGTGVLLEPMLHRHKKTLDQVVCVDTDSAALLEASAKLSEVFSPITLINEDFLGVCSADSLKFDCIVMNPPFGGKMAALVKLALDGPRCVPIEAAFVLKAVRLLQPGGRLLAIVPASLVSSLTTQWVRRQLEPPRESRRPF